VSAFSQLECWHLAHRLLATEGTDVWVSVPTHSAVDRAPAVHSTALAECAREARTCSDLNDSLWQLDVLRLTGVLVEANVLSVSAA
jgi:hypothetical protein